MKDSVPPAPAHVRSVSPEPPAPEADFPDLSNMPPSYMDLKEVFNKSKATSFPPHRPYDCAINLLPGTSPLKGRLYVFVYLDDILIFSSD